MNAVVDLSLIRNEQQDAARVVSIICDAAKELKDMVVLENPCRSTTLDQMANDPTIARLSRALAQIQLVASLAEARQIANEEIA